jgi:hypothetical protein
LAAEAARDQDRLDRQQEVQAQNDLLQQLIDAQTAAAAGGGAGAGAGAGAGVVNPVLKTNQAI